MSHKTIKLRGSFDRYDEAPAGQILLPGYLIERTAAGKVQKHTGEGSAAARMFVLEDALQGKTTAQAYAVDDPVGFVHANKGDELCGVLAAGETVVNGTELISAGNGTLIAASSAATSTNVKDIVAIAREVLDLTDTGAVDTLLAIQVL